MKLPRDLSGESLAKALENTVSIAISLIVGTVLFVWMLGWLY
jgi:hypothetical protein